MAWFGGTEAGKRAKLAVHAKRRALRKTAARGDAPPVDLDRVYAVHAGICCICKLPVARELATFDHRVPLAAGGSDTEDNLAPAHRTCNSSKGAKVGTTKKRKGLRRTRWVPKRRQSKDDGADGGVF